MKSPKEPLDEQTRLETLHSFNILDTEHEERFDRLTRMARRLFGVPIALVSLVDESRQWFKSCFGLSIAETSRDISFCGHAILGSDMFIIPDTSLDERFADNPLVMNEPYIRFYAGCPLIAPNGSKLGTLCIIDTKPRSFEVDELEALKDLASMVEREISAVHMATVDELTQISNRRGFKMLAQHSLHLCVRQNLPASLVFIDLDKFKLINDLFGHAEGDNVLISFAHELNKVCRDSDVNARFGGDEFAILLFNATQERAEETLVRLHQSVAKINQEKIRKSYMTFSYGIVEFNPKKHISIDALLADGDTRMYDIKRLKNQISY